MAERLIAKATIENGVAFNVELANLTPRSVFMITDRGLSFRQPVRLALEGIEIAGEIAFVAQDHPRGAVLVFETSDAIREKLARFMDRGEVLHASAIDEPWSDSTEPAPEILDEPTSEDARIDPHLFRAAFLLDNAPVITDVDTDEVAKDTFDSTDDTAVQIQLPELQDDGTLEFATAADYKAQYTSDIVKGGLLARSAPLPIGTQKMVRLSIPGLPEPLSLSARVGFVGSGTVGLMIDSFAKYKGVFEKLFNDLT